MFMIYVLSSMLESCMLGLILVMINLVRNLNLQLSIFPTEEWRRRVSGSCGRAAVGAVEQSGGAAAAW